jgi:hypothetical protein
MTINRIRKLGFKQGGSVSSVIGVEPAGVAIIPDGRLQFNSMTIHEANVGLKVVP